MTARTTDPATSHLAATYINGKRPGLKDAFLQALRTLGPSTANEIAQWCVTHGVSANAESVRKRALELVRDGLAKYGPSRACKVTGQQAGTLERSNADSSLETKSVESTATERRESTVDSGRDRKSSGHSQGTSSQHVAGLRNQAASQVSTPEAERVNAVAEFMRYEHDYQPIYGIAAELSRLAKLGTWPVGDSNEYIVAIEACVAQGLIERNGSKVRRIKPVKETKVVQVSLFNDFS